MDLQRASEAVLELADAAGKAILDIYKSADVGAETKGDGSPLTQADLAANAVITQGLRENWPEIPILTEEEADDLIRLQSDWVWIVDPLDGTKEFIKQNGEFTVNIALVHKNQPVLGVIGQPVIDCLYCGIVGEEAFLVNQGRRCKLRVSERCAPEEMILSKSRSHGTGKMEKLIQKVPFAEVLSRGSSLKGCLVAMGEGDVYFRFGPINEWDICAMNAVVLAAGGKMTDLDGNPMVYNQEKTLRQGFLASNGCLHEELLQMAREL